MGSKTGGHERRRAPNEGARTDKGHLVESPAELAASGAPNDAPGQNRSSLTPAGAAALARAHERRSLSRSQSLEKGAAADAAANALGGLELFEVPLGE